MNPTTDGRISWECESSYTSDSYKEIERWMNRLHEVTTLNCNMMVRSLHYVRMEARELLTYDGLMVMDGFLTKFEIVVLEQQRFDALKYALHQHPHDGEVHIKETLRTDVDVKG